MSSSTRQYNQSSHHHHHHHHQQQRVTYSSKGGAGIDIVHIVNSGDRSARSLELTVRSLHTLLDRPDRLSVNHEPLKCAIDAAFGISSTKCWLDLDWAQHELLSELLLFDGVLLALISELQHAPKVLLDVEALPRYALHSLSVSRELPRDFVLAGNPMDMKSIEVSLTEYFFIGIALHFHRTKTPLSSRSHRRVSSSRRSVDFATHLLQQLLDYFIPVRHEDIWPEQHSLLSERCDRGKEMLMLLCAWWMHADSTSSRDPDIIVPRQRVLTSLRRVLLHIVSIEDEHRLYEFIDVLSYPLFEYQHTLLSRWPLERLDMMNQVVGLWLAWLEPWNSNCYRATISPTHRVKDENFHLHSSKHEHLAANYSFWARYVHHNLMFYSVLLVDFFTTALHFDFTHIQHIQQLEQVLAVINTPDLINIVRDAEAKMGVMHNASASFGWRRFVDVCGQNPSLFMPFSLSTSVTHVLAGKVWTALGLADEMLLERLRNAPSDKSPHTSSGTPDAEAMKSEGNTIEHWFSGSNNSTRNESNNNGAQLSRKRQEELTHIRERIERTRQQLQSVFEFDVREFGGANTASMRGARATPAPTHTIEPELNQPDSQHMRVSVLTRRGREQVREGVAVCSRLDVPTLGGTWDQPATNIECKPLLHVLRNVSSKLPNINARYLRMFADLRLVAPLALFILILCFIILLNGAY